MSYPQGKTLWGKGEKGGIEYNGGRIMKYELRSMSRDTVKAVGVLAVTLGLFAVVATVGAFTDTSTAAPGANKGGPIHEGAEDQYKLGGLSVGSGVPVLSGEFLGVEHASGIPSLAVSAGSLRSGNNLGDTILNGNLTVGSPQRVVQTESGANLLVPEYNADLTIIGLPGSINPNNYNATFSELAHCSSVLQPVCVNDTGEIFLCDAGVDKSCLGQGSEEGGE